jgi:hypothetical protein
MALITTLVIMVVRASLAASLGLVGALSIIRFRTPVKEPEELAYLFMAIGIGVGMGVNQAAVTAVSMGLILLVLAVRSLLSRESQYPNLYVNIGLPGPASARRRRSGRPPGTPRRERASPAPAGGSPRRDEHPR